MARELIAESFAAAGLVPPQGAELVQPFRFSGGRGGSAGVEGANVVVLVPGTDENGTVLVVTAHYDHVGTRNGQIYNGADDNASGTAALLSIGRYLARNLPQNTIILAALDAEERGLRGAEALLKQPWMDTGSVVLNINLDMISRSDSVLYVAGASHTPALRPLLEQLSVEAPVDLRLGHDEPGVSGVDDWTNQSDHGSFHAIGIPFVYFGVEDHPDYHTPTDDAERIRPGFYMNSIRTILMAIRAFDVRLDDFPRGQQQ